ncbi:MAG: ZIP family metal transporter [Psychrobium sp.]
MISNQPLITLLLFTLLAGLAMPAGAILANLSQRFLHWKTSEIKHGIIAFGGGALLSAIALILVPQGIEHQTIGSAAAYFLAGSIIFMLIDIVLDKFKSTASQLVAMLSDFIPEALALGTAIALGSPSSFLLALLMILQNLPEGFNAYNELKQSSRISSLKIITLFILMSLVGPICGVVGYWWLADAPYAISSIMLVAAGGILYSVFQDIAPQAKLDRHWIPSLGATLGFLLGIVGHMSVLIGE